jgi:hypothetical protein
LVKKSPQPAAEGISNRGWDFWHKPAPQPIKIVDYDHNSQDEIVIKGRKQEAKTIPPAASSS